jgi:hypothetical protein
VNTYDRAKYDPFGTANGIGYPTQATDVSSSTHDRLQAVYTSTCTMTNWKKLDSNDLYFMNDGSFGGA